MEDWVLYSTFGTPKQQPQVGVGEHIINFCVACARFNASLSATASTVPPSLPSKEERCLVYRATNFPRLRNSSLAHIAILD